MRARAKWVAGIGATSALILAFGGVEAQQWAPPALVAANVRSQGAPT